MPVLVLLRSCEEWKAELQVVCFAVKTLMVSFTHTVFPSLLSHTVFPSLLSHTVFPSLLSLTHYSRTLGLKEKRSLRFFQAVKFLLLTSLQRLFEISGSHHIGNMELKFTGLAKLLPVNVNCVHAVIKQKMQVTYSQIQWRLLRSCANKHFLFASYDFIDSVYVILLLCIMTNFIRLYTFIFGDLDPFSRSAKFQKTSDCFVFL